jgi:retron-type reverse transcriptase
VNDTKKREIVMVSIRDRFVHRLLYEHLVGIYDKTFIFDVWSCREGKGLLGAMKRAQDFLVTNRHGFLWRGDVRKFFDSVDHTTLLSILTRRINDDVTMRLLKQVIDSYSKSSVLRSVEGDISLSRCGIAIGNVTSQVLSNIYLNELDRYVKHELRVKKYLRYGDDFVLFTNNRSEAVQYRILVEKFLHNQLFLSLHSRNDVIFPCRDGLKFLGCMLYPTRRRLQKRVWNRVLTRMNRQNVSSYFGLVRAHCNTEAKRIFDWSTLRFL